MNLSFFWRSPKFQMTLRYVFALSLIGVISTFRTLSRQSEFSAQIALQNLSDTINEQRASLLKVELLVEGLLLTDDVRVHNRIKPNLISELAHLKKTLQNREKENIEDIHKSIPLEKNIPILRLAINDLNEKVKLFIDNVDQVILSSEATLKQTRDLVAFHNTKKYLEIEEIHKILDSTLSYVGHEAISTFSKWDLIFYSATILTLILVALFLFRPMVRNVVFRENEQNKATDFLGKRNTELALSRESLRQQTRILKSMLYGLSNAIIVVDEKKKIILQNKSAENIFGVLDEENGLKKSFSYLKNANRAESKPGDSDEEDILSQIMQSRSMVERRMILINDKYSDGLQLKLHSTPLFDEEGFQKGAIFSFTDLTEGINRDKDVEKARSEAERANKAKSEFLANMSHEIRTPISIILGFIDKLLLTDQKPEEIESSLNTIARNARNLKELIDGILDISKIEAGQLQIEKSRVNLHDLINEVYGTVVEKAREKKLNFKIYADTPVAKIIETDQLRLKQILINVISNAIKFTPSGHVFVRLRMVQCDEGAGRLQFIVSDTGIGLSSEGKSRLFLPFAQADSTTARSFGGSGLGLALSRNLARALGGDIVLAASNLNLGSMFVVSIDPGKIDENELLADIPVIESKLSTYKSPAKLDNLEGIKVLIVEDVEENRDLCVHFIGLAGAEIQVAVDGYDALEKAPQFKPDVILMDIQMPKMDGHTAVKHLRANGFNGGIIATTAHALREEKERCLQSGFDEYLVKPIDFHIVSQRIKSLANSTKAQQKKTENQLLPKTLVANPIVEGIKKKFVHNLSDRLSLISKAIDTKNLAILREESHKIRGVAGACGYENLASDAALVEDAIFDHQKEEVIIDRARKLEQLTASIIAHNMGGDV